MAKKQTLPPKYSAVGFSDWGIKRTIREAENISRWNPWLALAWMSEARDQLSLDAPYFIEYDEAAERINNYWTMITKFRWYNEAEFWSLDGVAYAPQVVEYTSN